MEPSAGGVAPAVEKRSTRAARRARKAQAVVAPAAAQPTRNPLQSVLADVEQPAELVAQAEMTSPRSSYSSDTSLSPRPRESAHPLSAPPPCASWPVPLFALCVFLAQLLLIACQLWNMAMGFLLVLPARLLTSLGAPPLLLSTARRVAQSPLLLTASTFAVPLFLREGSYGVDASELPHRPTSLEELIGFLKPGRARSWAKRAARAQKGLAAAGITATLIPAGSFSPGVAHRRVVLAHVLAKNSSIWGRLFWLAQTISALHSFHSSAVEFRDSSGLVALSVQVHLGRYACGVLFAAKPAASNSGIWLSNLALVLPMLCEGGALQDALIFDVGPSFGELKSTLGLAPLPFGRTLRAALS